MNGSVELPARSLAIFAVFSVMTRADRGALPLAWDRVRRRMEVVPDPAAGVDRAFWDSARIVDVKRGEGDELDGLLV